MLHCFSIKLSNCVFKSVVPINQFNGFNVDLILVIPDVRGLIMLSLILSVKVISGLGIFGSIGLGPLTVGDPKSLINNGSIMNLYPKYNAPIVLAI